jgi:hypothetical protein
MRSDGVNDLGQLRSCSVFRVMSVVQVVQWTSTGRDHRNQQDVKQPMDNHCTDIRQSRAWMFMVKSLGLHEQLFRRRSFGMRYSENNASRLQVHRSHHEDYMYAQENCASAAHASNHTVAIASVPGTKRLDRFQISGHSGKQGSTH